jgi:ribose transport system ATP-binding protein
VVTVEPGAEETIVGLMLGQAGSTAAVAPGAAGSEAGPAAGPASEAEAVPNVAVRSLRAGTKLHDVSFELHAGEVLGVVALEGQGQDELFGILAGSRRPDGGDLTVEGRAVRFGHPADAIRAGLVYVPADRAHALLAQRSVRENIALPFSASARTWGPIDMSAEKRRVKGAIERLQIDTRAQAEVRRLSGGNQQKVTIARWIAGGVRTLLCFDPTRGIDIRTKREIYQLVRDLAASGAAVLLYTSELEEIQAACDRAIVIFGGRIVDEMPAAEADEPALMRAMYGLAPDAPMPEEIAAATTSGTGAAA